MALSPILKDGYRVLYFSPLASHREFAVSTRILRDETKVEESYHDFVFLPERAEDGHTTARVMDEDGLMLFNLIDQNAIGCWHSSLPYSPEYHGIVDKDDVTLVFPSDVKIDDTNTVWAMSDRMPVFLIAELDYTDINFRIFSAPLKSLVADTVCDVNKQFSRIITSAYTRAPTQNIAEAQPKPIVKLTLPKPASNGLSKAVAFNEHNGVTFEAGRPTLQFTTDYVRGDKYFTGLSGYNKPYWWEKNSYN